MGIEDEEPVVAILFFGICLVLGIASRHLLHGSKVPYTVALLLIGVALGGVEYGTSHRLGKVGAGIRIWAKINPDLLLGVFLPALLFEGSFSMDAHQIKSCMMQMFLLAGPGVLMSTFLIGAALKLTFPYDWGWKTSLLLGGLLSATDPVAVVALLKELGAKKKLSTLIEGESMMNDGMAIVVYQLFYQMVIGRSFSVGTILRYLLQASIGAVGIGLAFGIASYLWLGVMFNDTVIEISLTLAMSYVAYFTAQDGADVSGILTVMTLGMFYALFSKSAFKGGGEQSLHHFWEMIAYVANTLIFILSGVIIAEGVLNTKNFFEKHESLWGYLMLLYVFVQVSRAIVVGLLYPFLQYFGYGLDWKEATILAWSGLRGPVALALSLSVKRTSDNTSFLSEDTGTLFVFLTGWIVLMTLVLNGSAAQFILQCLRMDKHSEDNMSGTKRHLLDHTRYEMMKKALHTSKDLADDEELGPYDWVSVKRYLACMDDLEEEHVPPNTLSGSEHKLDNTDIEDIRVRLLNGVQAAYWYMLEEGRISQTTAKIMMQSVNEGMDLAPYEALCDWNGLKTHVHFPRYYRFLQMKLCPQKLVAYFIVERLELGCYICAAFLRAHRIARRQLHDYVGESEIASLVINESEAEGEEARKFLEDVRVIFPQVLRVLKTKQVAYSILEQFSGYVQNFERAGLSEEKELVNLHDTVQTDLKKLLRSPHLVDIPKTGDLLKSHPFIGALPAMVQEPLVKSTKKLMELHGVTIYREGSSPNGVWLISNGLVKWTSTNLKNKHSLHPIFSHGTSLGLYEVLVGKPYLCNTRTDSIVDFFFIDAEKILSLLRSDPTIEAFLWQESAIVIAKLLLPQVYEKMSIQELRALIVERSTMKIYKREETIEIPNHYVGFLLEGMVKTQEVHEELIPCPAVLLPLCGDLAFPDMETSGSNTASYYHQGSGYYLVETRVRVILFDMESFEADRVPQQWAAPWTSHSIDLRKCLSREHRSLMSWPEQFHMPIRRHQHSQEADLQENSLSARALQLSIFGSMVTDTGRLTQSFPISYREKAPNCFPYPRVKSRETDTCALAPGRSERATAFDKNPELQPLIESNVNVPGESGTDNDVILRIHSM